MARSEFLMICVGVLLAACAAATYPEPAPPAIAPKPQEYSCAFTRQLKAEYDALPPGSALRVFVNDGIALRDRNRAVRAEADPTPCPTEGERP